MIDKQEKKIEKLKDYIARNSARASTARQAQSRKKQLERLEIIEKPETPPQPKYRFRYSPISADVLIKAMNLSIGYAYPLLENIEFNIRNGEKVRITGFNGIGKTTLLRTILGEIPALKGSIKKHPLLKIGYFEQNLKWEHPERTPIDELRDEFPKLEIKELRNALAKVGLAGKYQIRPLNTLSGGEQSKVKLAQFTLKSFNFLILDEPTNHLDLNSKQALAKAINEYKGTVIFVSHEQDFASLINAREIDLKKNK